jgi:hypothetical protein
MTTDGVLGELLDICDGMLGEIGRRSHLFGWLRAPGGEDWLPVDAYYPGNRLVVMQREALTADDELIAERVPQHGMRLLWLAPDEFSPDPERARTRLAGALAELGPAPARPRGALTEARPSPVAQAVASLAQPHARQQPSTEPELGRRSLGSQAAAAARAARFVAAHHEDAERAARAAARRSEIPRKAPRTAATPARAARPARAERKPEPARVHRLPNRGGPVAAPPAAGRIAGPIAIAVAIVLSSALAAEVYFGVVRWAVSGGHVLLALGLALDTCARALGTIAAGRAGTGGSALACALGGSPFVAGFSLFGEDGPVMIDPAPLAGLLGLAAIGLLAVAFVVAALGG